MNEQLLKECVKHNIKAQAELYKLLSPKLFMVCLKYSKNYEEAQDNLQEAFLLIFDKIHQFKFEGSFEGWAKRVTINYVLQQYRSKKNNFLQIINDNVPYEEETFEFELDEEIPMDFLMQIIQDLPHRYKLVFNLYVFEKLQHKEIAEKLGINEGTSKSNYFRAKAILKDKIENRKKKLLKVK